MFGTPSQATLWVRYKGGRRLYPGDVFPIPITDLDVRVKVLVARGDVAEIWYCLGTTWDPKNHYLRYSMHEDV